MELRYEVSPSEAGTVVDVLRADGYAASLVNRPLGTTVDVVLVTDVDDAEALDALVTEIDVSAVRASSS